VLHDHLLVIINYKSHQVMFFQVMLRRRVATLNEKKGHPTLPECFGRVGPERPGPAEPKPPNPKPVHNQIRAENRQTDR
jgi:hypothetical protein